MTNYKDTLEAIESKLKKLIERKNGLEAKLQSSKSRIEQLESDLAERSKEIDELNETNKILRIAGKSKDSDNREIKLKINEIVREVDKCIDQLNQ